MWWGYPGWGVPTVVLNSLCKRSLGRPDLGVGGGGGLLESIVHKTR